MRELVSIDSNAPAVRECERRMRIDVLSRRVVLNGFTCVGFALFFKFVTILTDKPAFL